MADPDALVQFIRARLVEDAALARADLLNEDQAARRTDLARRFDSARVLRGVQATQRLLDEIFRYEATIDNEWACCHEANEIAAGLCVNARPEEIPALRALASEWSTHADYREEWKP